MDESINNKLTENQKFFFNKLNNYIDDETEIFFYGSIKRFDYIKNKSDVDIDIFTNNENSIINKLSSFLNIRKNEIGKVVYKIDNTIVNGYKLKYEDTENKVFVEMSIYNFKYKYLVKKQHEHANKLPFYTLFALYVIKHFYYSLNIIDNKLYSKIKHFLIHGSNERNFILM